MRDRKYNSLDKVKKQIDDILSSELCECRYAIYAHYNAGNGDVLFSYRKMENSVHLSINIQTIKSFIEYNNWNAKISIYFCAWYVAGYIKTLVEWEQKRDLNTYCDGIIFYEVLHAYFSKKKIKVYAPYICDKLSRCVKKMRVVDVFCEANTLLRIKAMFVQELLQNERTIIERVLDERMLYLKAPEVIYVGFKTPSLSLKEVMRNIRFIGKINTELNLPRLPKKNDEKLIHNLIEEYKTTRNLFWIELLAHMVVCSPNSSKYIDECEVLIKIYDFIERYEVCLIDDIKTYELLKNKIMKDNFIVILKYIERGKRLFIKDGYVKKNRRTIHTNY